MVEGDGGDATAELDSFPDPAWFERARPDLELPRGDCFSGESDRALSARCVRRRTRRTAGKGGRGSRADLLYELHAACDPPRTPLQAFESVQLPHSLVCQGTVESCEENRRHLPDHLEESLRTCLWPKQMTGGGGSCG